MAGAAVEEAGAEVAVVAAAVEPLVSGKWRVIIMPAETLMSGKPVGAGFSFRTEYRADLFLQREAVDCLEIIADHYFDATPEKLAELDLLASHFCLLPHGLNLSIGSASGLDERYVEQFAWLIDRVSPPWWSDHLAVTRAGHVILGHLSPISFNEESIEIVLRNLETLRRVIQVPMLLENITWNVHLPDSNMPEGRFLRRILEVSGAGLLLDLTNLYTNSVNHRSSLKSIIDELPLERVVQIHLAGGHVTSAGRLIDSHSRPVQPEVWELLDTVLERSPVRAMIIERDECLPPFSEIASEVDHARQAARRMGRWI